MGKNLLPVKMFAQVVSPGRTIHLQVVTLARVSVTYVRGGGTMWRPAITWPQKPICTTRTTCVLHFICLVQNVWQGNTWQQAQMQWTTVWFAHRARLENTVTLRHRQMARAQPCVLFARQEPIPMHWGAIPVKYVLLENIYRTLQQMFCFTTKPVTVCFV